jgi:hypothetical protein
MAGISYGRYVGLAAALLLWPFANPTAQGSTGTTPLDAALKITAPARATVFELLELSTTFPNSRRYGVS